MNLSAHLFDIAHAQDSGTLTAYLADAESNESLTAEDKEEIKTAATKRFAQLNAQVDQSFPKGRW